ncbi:MAG TPA: hypothetical protein VLI90_10045 [Tepidisphaeraceae bacterium]|nr:hypothetical protein [Tepidisphaeraceae bacterium]
MARPIPVWPRGPRRLRRRSLQVLLACPRVSPEWELAVVDALMRPKVLTKGKVEHRRGEQAWPVDAETRAREIVQEVSRRLDAAFDIAYPPEGEYLLVGEAPRGYEEETKALAAALSSALPEQWFVLGRLFVKSGRFYRRRFGYRMDVVPATDVHLPRAMRAKLKGLI